MQHNNCMSTMQEAALHNASLQMVKQRQTIVCVYVCVCVSVVTSSVANDDDERHYHEVVLMRTFRLVIHKIERILWN